MNTGLVIAGVVILIFGGIIAFDGYSIMEASQSSFLGIPVTDEEAYNYGFSEMIFGCVIAIIGLGMVIVGETAKTQPQQPTVVVMPPQPQYVPQPVYPPAPQPQYAPPPQQQAPSPAYPQYQQPIQQVVQPIQQAPPQPAPQDKVQKVQPIVCGECGKANPVSATFCMGCAAPLGTTKTHTSADGE